MLVGGACLLVGCSGSTPRDINFGTDAGAGFEVPPRSEDGPADTPGAAGAAGATSDDAGGSAGTAGSTAGAAGSTAGAAGSADADADAVSDGGPG
jgi:hypothetical protein